VLPEDHGVAVVVGATGHIGRHVVNGLARAGRQVRAVARQPESDRAGVVACPLDVRDADAFNAVLQRVDGIFLSLPPTLETADLARIAGDIARAGISTTVLLSSDLVAEYPGSIMAAGHEREESVLGAALGESLVTLRPGVFMENDAIEWSAMSRADCVVFTAFPDALQVPIAPVDIAAEAVAALTSPGRGPRGPQRLLGPQWLNVRDRVAVLGDVLNRPITIRRSWPACCPSPSQPRRWPCWARRLGRSATARIYRWARDEHPIRCGWRPIPQRSGSAPHEANYHRGRHRHREECSGNDVGRCHLAPERFSAPRRGGPSGDVGDTVRKGQHTRPDRHA
jgi:uncharacterized protein YbjT (DUF2867 family)